MVPGRISNTLSNAMQLRQHRSFSRLLVVAFMLFMVIIVVTVFALSSGSAPAGAGPSITAIDEVTDTIYVANGNNANGPTNAGGNTVSVIDGRHCKGTDVSRCKGPWPTLTVGNEPSNIAVNEAQIRST